ncbi:MAG TPA: SCO family protein, partial [Nevskiaceae bacterium]|nr:SCO family protein [Nevskiaceae bacterium]
YFGYTHCPDVCPTTLAKMAGVIRKLGPEAKNVRLLFVTVDPKRDTLPVMKTYLAAFDKTHFIGVRGTPAQIRDLAKRYRVAYNDMPPDKNGNYIVNHSSAIFIFGPHGNARLLGTSINTAPEYEADLKTLLSES